ncbi:hypothetical protein [Sulfurospirillum sp.]|uniref:hypothetical protein n=1 Tax=Sulfurospirillum sp. TaxID=2053622 RepID=UPI002FDEEF11
MNLTMLRRVFVGLCILFPLYSWAEFKDENLLQTLPNGYKIDFQTRKGNMKIIEMVPQNESVNNWSEMVTTQVFFGLNNATPESFQAGIQKMWDDSCKDAEFFHIAKDTENGYPFTIWLQICPLNQKTEKPEYTLFKAIKGNDSFYVVQKAFKFEPSKEQIAFWTKYFKSVMVCDTRLAERDCPKIN